MASTPANVFECSFKDCSASFDTKQLLKAHKFKTSSHIYCKVCDLDFENDDALHFHKIKSAQHICCPICNMDFRSQGGKTLHIKQMHVAAQNLSCVGCGASFVRAGGLISHIENNDCLVISYSDLAAQRAHKELVQSFLKDPERYASTSVGDDADSVAPTETDRSLGSDGGIVLSQDHKMAWPLLGSIENRNGQQPIDLLTGMRNLELRESKNAWGEPLSELLFSDVRQTPLPSVSGDTRSVTDLPEEARELSKSKDPRDPASDNFRPSAHFNSVTQRYVCPYPRCTGNLATVAAFKQHLKSAAHLNERLTCPGCLRVFGSTTALVQHCESPANRCKIRQANDYNRALDTITGGYLEADGYLPDGSIKYQAKIAAKEPTW